MDWSLKVAQQSVVVAFELLESADVSSTLGGNVGFILFAREIPARKKVLGKHFVLTFVNVFCVEFLFSFLYPESWDYWLKINYFLLSGHCRRF